MIASINFDAKMAVLNDGQTVPVQLKNGDKEDVEVYEEAEFVLIGPFNGFYGGEQRDNLYAEIRLEDIQFAPARLN